MKKALAFLMAAVMLMSMLTACGNKDVADDTKDNNVSTTEANQATVDTKDNSDAPTADADQAAADEVAALIDAIYVQARTEETDAQCEAAKAAWDALTDAQKALVEGEEASPDYFGLDTGDASKDDPRNQDEIGEKELLVVSFGTSFNDSRVADIKSIEDALQEANPDWSVRRAFTAQIIINHIQARDGEKIDNMEQALERAVANGVKQLVVQPTHLMHGAEYDEMCDAIDKVRDKFESVEIAEPMLGEVGNDATIINADKEAVAKAVVAAALSESGYESTAAAKEAGVAYVLMGHGTAHVAKVTYSQMATQMDKLGYENVFIGTVEGEPEDTSCEAVIAAVKEAGYTTVVLRPLMVVAGDHANNDMAGADEDSWKTMFEAAGFTVNCQISGLGRIADVQALYVAHTKAAIDAIA
ncbi:MAG: sirohydrochlorin cobaltochelatase [Oscillospiraceae bacterium]